MKNHRNSHLNLTPNPPFLNKRALEPTSRQQKQVWKQQAPKLQKDLIFHFSRYPFPNKDCNSNQYLRTIIERPIDDFRLKKFTSLMHPNLISLKKIVRGQAREASQQHHSDYFWFYYQQIPYSLKRIAALSESQSDIMDSLRNINFPKILHQLTRYLSHLQIHHEIKLDDIGIDEQFRIKIYLSPEIVCSHYQRTFDPNRIHGGNKNLINWWNTTFSLQAVGLEDMNRLSLPKFDSLKDADRKSGDKIRSNKSSFIVGQSSQIIGDKDQCNQQLDQMKVSLPAQHFQNLKYSNNITNHNHLNVLSNSIREATAAKQINTANDLKSSHKAFKSEYSQAKEVQKAKMRKIHEEVQKIKKKVYKTSFDYKLRKESDQIILDKLKQINKSNTHKQIFESAKFQKTNQNPEGHISPIKHNCETIQQNINCINIFSNHSPSKKINPNISSQQIFSYNIIPQPRVQYANSPLRNFQPHEHQDSNGSNTSFDIDIQDHKSPLHTNQFRHSLEPKQDISHLNFRNIDKKPTKENHIKVTNKNVTESAGPMHFKNIINKFIKPEFAPKKSNIEEDPGEDENQNQTPKHLPSKNLMISKRDNKKHSNYQKVTTKQSDVPQQKFFVSKEKTLKGRINLLAMLKNQRSASQLPKKMNKNENSLNFRVQQVLLKTKNAIELLNKVKSSESIKRREISP